MARQALTLLPLALVLAGCAPHPAPPEPRANPRITEVVATAAAQVKRCYRMPQGAGHAAKQIVTVIAVHYAPDGSLADLPMLRAQRGVTPDNALFAEAMAQAASLAVIRCAPIKLPPEYYYGGWDNFDLTFSFGMVA